MQLTASLSLMSGRARLQAVLDQIGVQFAPAYSVRQIGSIANCVLVGRSSDSATLEIGFINGWIDINTIMNFVGYNNLLLKSNLFTDAAWSKNLSTVVQTPAIVDPFGGGAASLFTFNAPGSRVVQQSCAINPNTTYTKSVYAKFNSQRFLQLLFNTPSYPTAAYANFDIQNGVLGTVSPGVSAAITPVGAGWYRLSATYTSTASAASDVIWIWAVTSLTSSFAENTTASGSTSAYIYGAQVNYGLLQPYQPTTTAIAAGNGWVIGVHDQSGLGIDAVQTNRANQAIIVANGVLQTANGKPALSFNGSTYYSTAYVIPSMTVASVNSVWQTSTTVSRQLFDIRAVNQTPLIDDGSNCGFGLRVRSDSGAITGIISPITTGVSSVLTGTVSLSAITGYLNGQQYGTTALSNVTLTGPFRLALATNGAGLGVAGPAGLLQEFLFTPNLLTQTQRQTLERNQGAAFGITVS